MDRTFKSDVELVEIIRNANPVFKENGYKFLGRSKSDHQKGYMKTPYGICKCFLGHLRFGRIPKITSSIDSFSYFKNKMNVKYRRWRTGYKLVRQDGSHVISKNKYGFCRISRSDMLMGKRPNSIKSAIDPTRYWTSMAREKHGDRYDYSKVEYKNNSTKVEIICSTHGVFKQTPAAHLAGRGCRKCANLMIGFPFSKWMKCRPGSNGKFYMIRLWDENEEFIKIGITAQTVEQRFARKKGIPYNYEIISLLESDNRRLIWDFEKKIKKQFKQYRYSPNIRFQGYTECFKIE